MKRFIVPLLVSTTLCSTPVLSHEIDTPHQHSTTWSEVFWTEEDKQILESPVQAQETTTTESEVSEEDVKNFGIGALVLLGIVLSIYFFPFGIALMRNSRYTAVVFVLNFFLGWTGLGWIASLVVACLP